MGSGKIYAIVAGLIVLGVSPLRARDLAHVKIVPALPRPGATKIFDNARGTVWDVIYPPGIPTGMHRHAMDFVGVELVSTLLKVTTLDGKAHIVHIHRGQIYMLHKGLTHIEENVIGQPQRNSILIQLKDGGTPLYSNPGHEPDGFTDFDARKVADNRRVILWDAHWRKGAPATSFFQSHDMFLVPIDAGILTVTTPNEPTRTYPLAGGQVVFLPGGHVRRIRSTKGNVRAAVVELK